MIVRHMILCICEAVSYLNMITALFVSAAAQKNIWMFLYDFVKGLIDTEKSLSFRNKIEWVFESWSQSFID